MSDFSRTKFSVSREQRSPSLWKALLFLLVCYSGLRLLFLANGWQSFKVLPASSIFLSLVHGIRFDVATIVLFNFPLLLVWIILLLLPPSWLTRLSRLPSILKTFNIILNLLFVLNVFGLCLNLLDVEYFHFSGRRSTLDVFSIKQDIESETGQLIVQYWYFCLVALALTLLTIFVGYRFLRLPDWMNYSTPRKLAMAFGITAAAVLGLRGGLQEKPLDIPHAFALPEKLAGDLTLNTAFVVLKAPGRKGVEKIRFFESDKIASEILGSPVSPNSERVRRRDNVVIIIMESVGAEYLGVGNNYKGYTPFLDSLVKKGMFFPRHFANGRRSIEALSSILAGIPSLMEESFITSKYSQNNIRGIGEVLGSEGYHSAFFHGGKNGTMFFDAMSRRAGFKSYYGLSEYPTSAHYDGAWGIYDGPFLQFFAEKMATFPTPFVSTVFTLTSHNPYSLPADKKGVFPKGTLPIHESVGYVDDSLAQFFASIENEAWYKDTLFVITSDHTALNEVPMYGTELGLYRVPLIFFHPSVPIFKGFNQRIAQHVDIMPTVLDFLGMGEKTDEIARFGHSLLDETFSGRAVNQLSGTYWMVHDTGFLKLDPNGGMLPFQFSNPKTLEAAPEQKSSSVELNSRILKAFIQQFNNGMIENKLAQ